MDRLTRSSAQWPSNRLLRLRGRIPVQQVDLGRPRQTFASEWLWAFTYPMMMEIPRDFAVHSSDPIYSDDRTIAVGLEEGGIFVDSNPHGRLPENTWTGFSFLDENGQLTGFSSSKNYEFGSVATFCMVGKDKRIDIIAESIEGEAGRFRIPSVDLDAIATEADLKKAVAQDDVARGIAARIDLPAWMFPHLVACPDPVTRALLVKNPALPAQFVAWAMLHPSLFKQNEALPLLLSNMAGFDQPLASAQPELRDEILERLR